MDVVTVDNKSSVDDNYDEDAFAVFDSLDKSDSITECNQAIELNPTRETNQALAISTNVCIQTINQHTQQALRGDDSYNIIKHNKLTEKEQKRKEEEPKEISHDNGITVLSYGNKIEDGDDGKENNHCSNSCNIIIHTSSSKDNSFTNNVNKLGQIKLEKNSNIRVKRCTRSFDQLPVLLAQYPFATFSQLRLLSTKCYNDTSNTSFNSISYSNKNSTLARCCVGVVSYRGEPKQNHKSTSHSTFAVIRIWNMHGFSPFSSEELALLLCNSAFDILYSQLMLGSVIAVVNLSLLSSSSSSSSSPHYANNIDTSNTKHDGLYRVHDIEQIRLLGYAAELGTCNAISKNSQERCHNLVNTHISQYCMYHLNEVKKVARGVTNANVNKTVTMNINNNNNNNNVAAITPNQFSYVFAHNQRTPIVPATTSPSSSLQPLNVSRQQSTASRTAILKQPSFLIVKGNNGLPVHSHATQHRMNVGGNNNNLNNEGINNNAYENNMYGEGIYAGVCKGSALSINNKINSLSLVSVHDKTLHANNSVSNNSINTHNTLYPATSVHNITTRGRDVLAIAQQQENAQQQARLLRSALCTTTSEAKDNNNLINKFKKSVSGKNKAMPTNLPVANSGKHDLLSSQSEQRCAKRVRADNSTQLIERERKKRNTTRIESGNTKIKRSSAEEEVKNKTERSSETELTSKSAYPSRQSMKSYHKINDELIRAVKEQCAPLNSIPLASSSQLNNLSSNVYFVPEVNNMERVELVIDYQHTNSNDSNKQEASNKNMGNENVNRRKCNSANARKQIITQTLSGHRSALVNTVAKAIRNRVILPSSTSSSCSTLQLLNTQQEKQLRQEEEAEKPHLQQEASSAFGLVINRNKNNANSKNSTAITLLGEIASQMHSAHDSLRSEAEINRLNAQLDKSIAQEKAIALLSSIHEQPIDATYCYECNSWSTKALDSCVTARHRLEVKQTVKRFIECEYCHYKTFVLGNEADRASHAWKLLPMCPRCHQRCIWNKSNAAPNFINSRSTQYMTSSDTNASDDNNCE